MAFNFKAQSAKKENVFVKVFLSGVSGSGKSYSAQLLAEGMADEIEAQTGTRPNIIMFNTEGSRGRYYANEFKYDIWPTKDIEEKMTPEDFTIDLYVDWINFTCEDAKKNGIPPIIIIDGVTPAWDYAKALHAKAGGAFKDWKKVDPHWNNFCRTIVASKAHIIACARGKSQYVVDGDKGSQKVKKMGVGADMRDGFDFEFTCSFNIDQQTHSASVDKDNTHIFDSRNVEKKLTKNDGVSLIKWANSDVAKTVSKKAETAKVDTEIKKENKTSDDTVTLSECITQIKSSVDNVLENCASDKDKTSMRGILAETIKKYVVDGKGNPVADYRLVKDVDTAKKVIEAIKNIVK